MSSQAKPSPKETLLNAAVLHWMHDLAAQGIITTDSELNVVEWNNWMEEHTGKRANEVIGNNLLDLFPELTQRRLDRHPQRPHVVGERPQVLGRDDTLVRRHRRDVLCGDP